MGTVISFKDIYSKAIGLFDDPKITIAYETNLVQFYKLMYTFLQTSLSLFNNPISVVEYISQYEEPTGQMEIFVSRGGEPTFELDPSFIIRDNAAYVFTGDGRIISGAVNKEARTVTFSEAIEEGKEYSFEQYYIGQINCPTIGLRSSVAMMNNINNCIEDILARLLVKSWGENTRNFLLDIQNILTDTDFKLHSSSAALKAKNEWVAQLDAEILQYQNKLAWNLRMLKSR